MRLPIDIATVPKAAVFTGINQLGPSGCYMHL
jgi:hypothetical protein